MTHRTFDRFWKHYEQLPDEIKRLADKNYELLKNAPFHPSLRFKRLGERSQFWSARESDAYRALALRKTTPVTGSGSVTTQNTID